jgi:hypothetical protein
MKASAVTAPLVAFSMAGMSRKLGILRPVIHPCTVDTGRPSFCAKAVRDMSCLFRYSAIVMR